MIMIVKTPKSQKGSTVPAEERAEGRGGGRGEGGKGEREDECKPGQRWSRRRQK